MSADSGKWVWIKDEAEGWLAGRLLDGPASATEITVSLQNGERRGPERRSATVVGVDLVFWANVAVSSLVSHGA